MIMCTLWFVASLSTYQAYNHLALGLSDYKPSTHGMA